MLFSLLLLFFFFLRYYVILVVLLLCVIQQYNNNNGLEFFLLQPTKIKTACTYSLKSVTHSFQQKTLNKRQIQKKKNYKESPNKNYTQYAFPNHLVYTKKKECRCVLMINYLSATNCTSPIAVRQLLNLLLSMVRI